MNKTIVFASLFSAALIALPASATAPNWNNVEISYAKVDIDELDDISLKGFSAAGTALIGNDFFLQGRFTSVSDTVRVFSTKTKVDLDWTTLGLGYRYAATSSTDVYATLAYEGLDVKASALGSSFSEDENGYSIAAGVRSMLTDKLEAKGSISYMDIGDGSDTAFEIGGSYYFTPAIAAGASYLKTQDLDVLMLTGRYSF
ncbi:porin family protein [Lacimicrobium alkaliphilum]|uniref:Outer membrane protein beta-barrel domain-containing protein n=1 Tax=Lacimicrobium alkaliphilum TaxID=1526571 RepID=A0A0U3AXA2_9ALTE|nr:porin family protein [Lacimicrobium alkaliphilum]ALS97624.1 hypothetical protein AT746_04620 [Lacimicrobium alkaliphilum]